MLQPSLPTLGLGAPGLLQAVENTLRYSVNTFDRGFLDKLYASTDAPGIASELVLATLNTNVHVYAVSPALTIIEKEVTRALASLFGLRGEHSGGVSVQGGAASNMLAYNWEVVLTAFEADAHIGLRFSLPEIPCFRLLKRTEWLHCRRRSCCLPPPKRITASLVLLRR